MKSKTNTKSYIAMGTIVALSQAVAVFFDAVIENAENLREILVQIFSQYIPMYFIAGALVSYAAYRLIDMANAKEIQPGIMCTTGQIHLFYSMLSFICWIPYLIVFYPGTTQADTGRYIAMAFHLPTRAGGHFCTDGINYLYSSHHPVILELIYGGLVKLGMALGSPLIGHFIHSILQMTFMAFICGKVCAYLYKKKTPRYVRLICFIWWGVVPFVAINHIAMCGDVIFAMCCIWALLKTYEIIDSNAEVLKTWKGVFAVLIPYLAVVFTKKQGLYIVALICIICAIVYRRKFIKQFAITLGLIVIVFNIGFEGLLYPVLRVNKGSVAEMLSVPITQTAKYLKYHPELASEEELELIGEVLPVKDLSEKYNPHNADEVKATWNEEAGRDEIIGYFNAWRIGFTKSPTTYLTVPFEMNYRYFDFRHRANWGYYSIINIKDEYYLRYKEIKLIKNPPNYNYEEHLDEWDPLFYQSPEKNRELRQGIKNWIYNLKNVPVIRLFYNIGFLNMIMIGVSVYLIGKRKWKYLVPQLFGLLCLGVCFISPLDGHPRYMLPILYMLPLLFAGVFISEKNIGSINGEQIQNE